MWQQRCKRLLLISKSIIGKWWTITERYRVIWQRKFIRFLLLPIGIIGILVIILVVPLSYTPDTSVPFPYIPPPEGDTGYYINTNSYVLQTSFFSHYVDPRVAQSFIGNSLIFKNVETTDWMVRGRTETSITTGFVQFVFQNPSDLNDLKAGDEVDIIGVCVGRSEEWPIVVVVENCQFLPAGLVPLPLSGKPAIIISY